jgi:protein-S-isoprenylcysteine O-methyltransferase Ste14
VQGLYRYVRNPMYLAVTLILAGEALLMRSRGLALYTLVFFAAANLFVMTYEEPYLRKRFGQQYEIYTRLVGRWVPSARPFRGGRPGGSTSRGRP